MRVLRQHRRIFNYIKIHTLEMHTFKNLMSLFYRSVNKVSEKLNDYHKVIVFLPNIHIEVTLCFYFFPFVLLIFSIMKL